MNPKGKYKMSISGLRVCLIDGVRLIGGLLKRFHWLFTIYMGKTSHPRFRQLDAKYRTGKFHPGIALTICTNQFHLPENDHQGLKLVSKMALKKWNRNFCLEYSVRKTGLPFQMFRCSWKFSAGMTQKGVSHLFSNWIL